MTPLVKMFTLGHGFMPAPIHAGGLRYHGMASSICELYRHGLQRSQLLPAIELLKKHLRVVNVDSGNDYRLRALERVEIFHAPLDQAAERNLAEAFDAIARGEGEADRILEIEGRPVRTRRLAEGVVWFEFSELCGGPRGKDDYIELSRNYHTVLLSGVPQISPDHKDWARRFTWLVDEFYDRRVKLICSARLPQRGPSPSRTQT